MKKGKHIISLILTYVLIITLNIASVFALDSDMSGGGQTSGTESASKGFSVAECGQNCLEMLAYIKDGNILWKLPVLHCILDGKHCDINIDNKHFSNFDNFIEYIMD